MTLQSSEHERSYLLPYSSVGDLDAAFLAAKLSSRLARNFYR